MYHRYPHPIQNLGNPIGLYKNNDYFVMKRELRKESTCFLQIYLPKNGAVLQFINSQGRAKLYTSIMACTDVYLSITTANYNLVLGMLLMRL